MMSWGNMVEMSSMRKMIGISILVLLVNKNEHEEHYLRGEVSLTTVCLVF